MREEHAKLIQMQNEKQTEENEDDDDEQDIKPKSKSSSSSSSSSSYLIYLGSIGTMVGVGYIGLNYYILNNEAKIVQKSRVKSNITKAENFQQPAPPVKNKLC